MAENKTTSNAASVEDFLAAIPDERRRTDAQAVCALIRTTTGAEPQMWGTSIVGFGTYHYRYASGRTGDWMAVGFSPRAKALTVYISDGFDGYGELLARLGTHSTGKSCLYLPRLSDVDTEVLRELVDRSFKQLNGSTITT
jgi:hypothetical protein